MKRANILIILFILLTSCTLGQFGMPKDLVKIKTYQSFDKVYPGTEFKIGVKTDVADTWHINSDKPYDEYLIPTGGIIVVLRILEYPALMFRPSREAPVSKRPHDHRRAAGFTVEAGGNVRPLQVDLMRQGTSQSNSFLGGLPR